MKKILIIEDDEFLGDVLFEKLSNKNFEVKLIKDGNLAISEMKLFLPDLVLLDILLPNLNGYEILEQKIKNEDIKDVPVIIISNSGQPIEITRALNLGVKDYLIKADFDPEEVLVKVRRQIGHPDGSVNKTVLDKFEGKTIMWVEDDQFLNDLIASKISKLKCNFIHIKNGIDVLEKLKTEQPDLIMLDILLPEMDGMQILNQIKKNQKTKNIPVIVVSNLNEPPDIEEFKKMGSVDFIIKSNLTLDEIFERMVEFL